MAACKLYRKDGKIEKVLAENGKPSILYQHILNYLNKKDVDDIIKSVPYLQNALDTGLLLNKSKEEIAAGLWSIVYTPEFMEFYNKIKENAEKEGYPGMFSDANGEPTFGMFEVNILGKSAKFTKPSSSYALSDEDIKSTNEKKKRGNKKQSDVVDFFVLNPKHPFVKVDDVCVDEEGDEYDDISADDSVEGGIVRKIVELILLGKNVDEIKKEITNFDKYSDVFDNLQSYISELKGEGAVVLNNVIVGDNEQKKAGSIDLFIVKPNGKLGIVKFAISSDNKKDYATKMALYKKLVELYGFDVDNISIINIKPNNNGGLTYVGEYKFPLSINEGEADSIIPTEIKNENPLNDKDENEEEDEEEEKDEEERENSKEEGEKNSEEDERNNAGVIYNEVKKVIDLFEARKKYFEELKKGKLIGVNRGEIVDKMTELIVMMKGQLKISKPSIAYGEFLQYSIKEVKEYLSYITNPDSINDKDFIDRLLYMDKYIESYRGIVSTKDVGSKEQKLMLIELLDLLDDAKESIDNKIEEYVKKIVKEKSKKELTKEELDSIMNEVYDIKTSDYLLRDMATSGDPLLAITDKIFKDSQNKVKDNTERKLDRIYSVANKLLKELNIEKPDEHTYDFMKVFNKKGNFTGRIVSKIGQVYYDIYNSISKKVKSKNDEYKQYIPITNLSDAKKEDLEYNIQLYHDKKEYREFMNPEVFTKDGVKDGKYHKYTDEFKKIRSRYQDLVRYTKFNGEVYYKWERKPNISDEQYDIFLLKYFNESSYWGPVFEKDGTFHGRVELRTDYFVKSQYVEIRDFSEDGIDLRDPKYVKLMNPQNDVEKAQSEFYKAWLEEYNNSLEELPQDVISKMRNKFPRVAGSFFDILKTKGGGFTKAVSKSVRNMFTPVSYTNQRLVDESGQIDEGIPILFVGKLRNEGRVDYLKKELENLKNSYTDKKITKKEYLEKKNKLREQIKIEESRISADEMEGDIVKSLTAFVAMAENYSVMSTIESDLKAIQKIVEKRIYYQTDAKGVKLIQKGTKDEAVAKKKEEVNVIKRLRKWFEMVYYNNSELNKTMLSVVSSRIQNLTSLKGVGFNVFGNINNYLIAKINNYIETAGELYFKRKAYARASEKYKTDYLTNVFLAFGKGKGEYYSSKTPNSKYEALVSYFRMVRKYQADSGKVDIMNFAYFLQEGGEYNVQSKVGIAILMSKELKNKKTGETLSIYDAFDFNPNTGELKLKEGFELSDQEKYDIINYILEVNKQIHGNYAYEDRMVIQQSWLGQLAAQFHKHLYPAYTVRFGPRYFDNNLGWIEGRYTTIMNFLAYVKQAEGTFFEKLRTGWKDMDEIQIRNMYKNLAELAFFAASFAMYAVFRSLAEGVDDDDKVLKRWLNFFAYQNNRQVVELSTMMPIIGVSSQYQIAKSPIAILTTLKDFGEAIKETLLLPFPPYEDIYYEKGIHKGDLRAIKEWKDVVPAVNVLNKWESFDQIKTFYIK